MREMEFHWQDDDPPFATVRAWSLCWLCFGLLIYEFFLQAFAFKFLSTWWKGWTLPLGGANFW